jgi:4-hydroxy-3-methylbut-2-enyl diphosphate reductase IspH
VNHTRKELHEINERLNRKPDDSVIKRWVTDHVNDRVEELRHQTLERFDALEKRVEKHHDDISKYVKMKFDLIQEKHFTVPDLVGTDSKYPYSFLGDFLSTTYKANKEHFESLEA